MRSADSPFLFCRICGTRYRSDKVDQHEKTCSEKSKGTEQTWLEKDAPSNVYLHKALSSMSDLKKLNATTEETGNISKLDTDDKYQSTPERPPKLTSVEHLDEDEKEMVETPYPSPSSIANDNQIPLSPPPRPRSSQIPGENPKQAWNANAKRQLSAKIEMPKFIKKYRHYPVSCEFCNKKFQPAELRKHIKKYHADAYLPVHLRGENVGKVTPPSDKEKPPKKVKRVGDGPRFRVCYICGRQFGSKSLPIHEPKCLEKWRIQNDQLPPDKRMPEPIKPGTSKDPELEGNLPGSEGYRSQLPEMNAENEAAYQSHLRNLVPCSFCGRRFNPDRIMIHENACIEKPKKRQYITPKKDGKT